MNKGEDTDPYDPWFEEDEDETPEPSDTPSDPPPVAPPGFDVLGTEILTGARATELLRRLGLSDRLKERKRTSEEKKETEQLMEKAAELAKGNSLEEVNEILMTSLTARAMQAHCADCMDQLKKSMVGMIEDMPVSMLLKYKKKYNIGKENEE